MTLTPLQRRRLISKEFERICGVPTKYTKPWDPPTVHPIALALHGEDQCPIVPAPPEEIA